MANISGDEHANVLKDLSTDASSNIYGYGNNDTLYGLAYEDFLFGGDGMDRLYGGLGNDWLMGGKDADRLDGGDGIDGASYYSTTGVTAALDGSLKAQGEAVGDTYHSIEKLEGSYTGSDILSGNASDNTIWSYGGNDKIYGRAGDDWLLGGNGADRLDGGGGIDGASYYIDSTAVTAALDHSIAASGAAKGDSYVSIENLEGTKTGADTLSGNTNANSIWGDGGSDVIFGRAGRDWLYGGLGQDQLFGGPGDDFLRGGTGADQNNGGTGSDAITYGDAASAVTMSLDGSLTATGEAKGDTTVSIENIGGSRYNDILSGNAQSNTVVGLKGHDTLYGRGGNDKFYFTEAGQGTDTIMDFAAGDRITFEDQYTNNLATGTINSNWFITANGHTALDANDRFIYDQTDHSLWYDADGTGTTAAAKIAIFQNAYVLNYSDISIVNLF